MDVDEFINVKVGEGYFRDFFVVVFDVNMIVMIWCLFGNLD